MAGVWLILAGHSHIWPDLPPPLILLQPAGNLEHALLVTEFGSSEGSVGTFAASYRLGLELAHFSFYPCSLGQSNSKATSNIVQQEGYSPKRLEEGEMKICCIVVYHVENSGPLCDRHG